MRHHFYYVLFLIFGLLLKAGFSSPHIGYTELAQKAEANFKIYQTAREAAINQGLPVGIYLPEGIFMEALGLEDGQVVYGIVTNLAHPFENASTAFFPDIEKEYDLSKARLSLGQGKVTNEGLGIPEMKPERQASLLLIPESSGDRVMAFDAMTGDLVDMDFIPPSTGPLSTPVMARQTPWGNITISDQLADLVQEFDTSGTYLGIFAPAGGVNNAILDNMRSHIYKADGNLLATVAGGGNADAIAEFDQSGIYLGNFIANGLGGLAGPWDIVFRTSDILITGYSSDAVHRYDLSGNYLDDFVSPSGVNSPEQLAEFQNGNVAVAAFSTPSGIYVYSPAGTLLSTFTGVTGNRGVYKLGNGNIITTNGAGVHEIDGTTGALVRTIVPGVSGRLVAPYVEAAPAAGKILISEFVVTPTDGEFIEIYNPGADPVDLSNYYLTDATFAADNTYYYNIVRDTLYGGGAFGDFHARFPDGAVIQPGEYQTIAMTGTGFVTSYAVQPTYELFDTDSNIPDMREARPGSINGQGGLTNSDEVIVLYYWDGLSDLVGDVDYVIYDDNGQVPNEAVDKTGISIDGPDPDTLQSTYLPDTPINNQLSALSPEFGYSAHRVDYTEGNQVMSGGNGITGADETSEDLNNTFTTNSEPSPNAPWKPIAAAKLQLIHNAADPSLAMVDIYLNGTKILDDFAFRTATPFLSVGAGTLLNFGFAPENSISVADTIRNFPVVLDSGVYYNGFATGVVDTNNFAPNPEGRNISLKIFGNDSIHTASSIPGQVEISLAHGVTDAPTVDIVARNLAVTLFDNVPYGDVTPYLALMPASYTIDIMDSSGQSILSSFEADLSALADSAVVIFASGFADSALNQNGPSAGLYMAMTNGTVVQLPQVMNYAQIQLVHNAPDPNISVVDIYYNDNLWIDDFTFRHATPFMTIPAGQLFTVGIAPGNSTSVNDTIVSLLGEFAPNDVQIGFASGVLNPNNFAPNPNGADISFTFFGNDSGREVSQTPGSLEMFVAHGATDAPTVDVVVRNVGPLFEDVSYGDVTGYIAVQPGVYTVDLVNSATSAILDSFDVDLSALADSAIGVFASGFLDSAANQNGPSFGLYAALANGQVVELPAIPTAIAGEQDIIPREFDLYQNYPNPFNPNTTIRYALKQSTRVTLTVYNLLGQEVRTLVNAQQEAGYKTVIWDGLNNQGRKVASGIYLYRLEAGDFVKTRKMVLMK